MEKSFLAAFDFRQLSQGVIPNNQQPKKDKEEVPYQRCHPRLLPRPMTLTLELMIDSRTLIHSSRLRGRFPGHPVNRELHSIYNKTGSLPEHDRMLRMDFDEEVMGCRLLPRSRPPSPPRRLWTR